MKTQRLFLTFPLNPADFVFPVSKNFFCCVVGGIFLLVISLLIFYLFQIEGLTKENYFIKMEQKKIEGLSEESLFSEKEYTRLFALKNLEQEINTLGLVKVSEIKYIPFSNEYLVQEKH